MARTKDVVLSIRTTAAVKGLIQKTAEQERRSTASMIEVMALDYAKRRGRDLRDALSTDINGRKIRTTKT